ncbi:MAG: YebC/PmpR family DNA-binding transcriptional regulator [Rhodanobacter sp.]|jgi:YebC/PmpR family DNA-binding regulatory protein|uniref:Probable transcriptional regulatory protein CS053_04200 n=2 Tax=Gammaproteobacteria TaxID=1236 RepID=A0A5B9E0Q5_9GAMM|nr:YebC/PmpR family DNA-binding transcriptional regulator [Rhodanobacter glycinis]QEE23807.1 YebC/PmpR family DNA-binding transcriptional regulator [Rhodanobacter glycinis]TAM19315.1 MAG: YebC/PmpR family DNA-binding transcriptional regulator [Rhodanobacter sp.]
MGRGPSIEGRKNAEDAKRAKVFTKLIREITVATRSGVADPAGNPRLRAAMDKALAANMTKDTIERAIKRGSGADGGADMQELRYEGYGPAGTALIIDCFTDNPTRTVADVRHALTRHGGNLGTSGSVAFQFTRCGELVFATRGDEAAEEKVLEAALEAGADDVVNEHGESTVLCAPEDFETVQQALSAAGLESEHAGVSMRPNNRVAVPEDAQETLATLLEKLDALDDVSEVYHNALLT